MPLRLRNDWNEGLLCRFVDTRNGGECAMYIGLGGLLILILVLWLLGVI